jgi:hypothetical protein
MYIPPLLASSRMGAAISSGLPGRPKVQKGPIVSEPPMNPDRRRLTESAPHDGFGTHPAQSNGSVGTGDGCHLRGEDSRTDAVDPDPETSSG